MASVDLPPALHTLLDAANAEAKRLGHSTATVVDLAAAIARRNPDLVTEQFGEGAATRLLGDRVPEMPELPTAEELLGRCGTADLQAVLTALADSSSAFDAWLRAQDDATAAPSRNRMDQESAAAPEAPQARPIERYASIVTSDEQIVGRTNVVSELLAFLTQRVPATPLVLGPAGSGKTAILHALAAQMQATPTLAKTPLVRVGVDSLLGDNPIEMLDRVLDAATDEVIAIDDLDVALALGTRSAITPMLTRLRAAIASPHIRLLLCADSRFSSRLETADGELFDELVRVNLDPLPIDLLQQLACRYGQQLANFHEVVLDDDVPLLAASAPTRGETRVHPGLLVARLDSACTRALVRGRTRVTAEDLELETIPALVQLAPQQLAEALSNRVRGQQHAVSTVARRLCVTRAGLDLRPGRPDGVFLFVGPTGVGKTELARALADTVYGSEQALIRLDMSEYADRWALSRLVGPQPGYVGSTEPESWLTTKVIEQPESVVLLDEIEKADSAIWNAFLQVFDAGRLTDSRGAVADFSQALIIMTSNIGANSFSDRAFGFGNNSADDPFTAVKKSVETTLAPELINRLDGIIVFNPLDENALLEIAEAELERFSRRLAERGFGLTYGSAVPEALARHDRDPRYGARHLQRNIERLILEPIAESGHRIARIEVTNDGEIVVSTE